MLSYKNIYLIPKYSELISRSEADTSIEFLEHKFKAPIIPANMECTINFKLAEELFNAGYFYILHRFYPYNEILKWIKNKIKNCDFLISISVGVKEKDYEFINQLKNLKVPKNNLFITIDIAHGFSISMKKMISFIKKEIPYAKIIAGNVAGEYEAIKSLQEWGVDAIKIGIGPGAGCTTYDCTGFTSPMFSAGLDATEFAKVPLIGDGGIRVPGDITKAIVAGYDMVMIGSLFAACIDSPADVLANTKIYYGSASSKAKGHRKHVEGKTVYLNQDKFTYLTKLTVFEEHLRSSISYAGGKKLKDLREVNFEQIIS